MHSPCQSGRFLEPSPTPISTTSKISGNMLLTVHQARGLDGIHQFENRGTVLYVLQFSSWRCKNVASMVIASRARGGDINSIPPLWQDLGCGSICGLFRLSAFFLARTREPCPSGRDLIPRAQSTTALRQQRFGPGAFSSALS